MKSKKSITAKHENNPIITMVDDFDHHWIARFKVGLIDTINRWGILMMLFGMALSPGARGAEDPRPNIVLIMADDLGWKDVGFNGAEFFETPNLDQLASEGTVFTDAYSDGPVCTPTRAALMTGKTPARLRITTAGTGVGQKEIERNGGVGERRLPWPAHFSVKPPIVPLGLPAAEKTLAEYLKEAGYTTGFVGKWHLGFDGAHPTEQGFDFVYTGEEIYRYGQAFLYSLRHSTKLPLVEASPRIGNLTFDNWGRGPVDGLWRTVVLCSNKAFETGIIESGRR
jgi:arylsulfatase A-like enzyme